MGIIGLTDGNGPNLPKIGNIRKGDVKGDRRPGADLGRFMRFTSEDMFVEQSFIEIYGDRPESIPVLMPGRTVDHCFVAWREQWGGSKLIHRCDGQHVVKYRDKASGQDVYPHFGDVACPYQHMSDTAQGKDRRPCSPVGRLNVIVPGLPVSGTVLVATTSKYDIAHINRTLEGYNDLIPNLTGVPFILTRRPQRIAGPSGALVEKWLLHLEIEPAWWLEFVGTLKSASMMNFKDKATVPVIEIQGEDMPVIEDDEEEYEEVVEGEEIIEDIPGF